MKVELIGTWTNPALQIRFGRTDRFDNGTPIMAWVKGLPGRRWSPETTSWHITCFGMNPEKGLAEFGLTLENPETIREWGLERLNDMTAPLVKQSTTRPSIALVRPRFSGFERTKNIIGPAATWDKEKQWFEIRLADIVKSDGTIDPRLQLVGDVAQAAIQASKADAPVAEHLSGVAAVTALSTGIDMTAVEDEAFQRLVNAVGDVPDWFGLDLYPYQRLGAVAAAAGRTLLCDSPGLGKTRQALGCAAIKSAQRTLIVVPPVVVTNWARETEQSGLHTNCGGDIVMFSSKRKEPELPETGVVVVPDSLLVSRPVLAERLIDWNPDFLIFDEAHRARNWESKRSKVMRDLCDRLDPDTFRVAITGTPIFSAPHELAPLLAITGHLDPVFGGSNRFLSTYSRQNHFKAWVPIKKMLAPLRQHLGDHVWVRRLKKDVLTELPTKSRASTYVDVDLKDYRRAHTEVIDKLAAWLEEFHRNKGRWPTETEESDWAKEQIGVISPLRKAAGVAKVPHALELINEWVSANTLSEPFADGSLYDRPLLIWAHHQEVVASIREGIAEANPNVQAAVEIIDGATSAERRGEIVDKFQAGKVAVLIASITAAGVGITLTRGSDMIFVETDWTPALVSQSEDRQSRIGQTMPVLCRTLIAEGTLDEHVQKVLQRKAETLNAVLGGDEADVFTAETGADLKGPSEIVVNLLALARRQAEKNLKKAA